MNDIWVRKKWNRVFQSLRVQKIIKTALNVRQKFRTIFTNFQLIECCIIKSRDHVVNRKNISYGGELMLVGSQVSPLRSLGSVRS